MTRDGDWSAGNPPQGFQQSTVSGAGQWNEPPALDLHMPGASAAQQSPPQQGQHDAGAPSPQLESLLQSLVTRLGENDKRYSAALNDLYNRLDGLSARAGSARTAKPDHAADALNRVEAQAAALAQQVREADQLRRAQQADASLRALDSQFSEYASQMQPPRSDREEADTQSGPHYAFGRQFTDVTDGFEQTLAAGHPTAGLDEINRKINDLSSRLDSALADRTDAAALRSIEAQMNNLTAQFAHAQEQYARVESIESNLCHLMNAVRSTGASIDDAAQKAVQKAVQAFGADSQNVSGRLDQVQRDLQALAECSREIDGRTVGTLETMNATLQSLTSQIVPNSKAAAAPRPRSPDPAAVRERHAEAPGADEAPAPVIDTPRNTVGAAIPDFQEPPQQREAQSPDAMMRPGPLVAGDDDFLASARRAAQKAASQQPSVTERKSFFSRFRRKSAMPPPPARRAPASGPRPMLVIAAILLLGSSAAFLYGKLTHDTADPGAGKPEQSAPASPGAAPEPPGPEKHQGSKDSRKDTSKLSVPGMPATQIPASPVDGVQVMQAPGQEAQGPAQAAPASTKLPKAANRTGASHGTLAKEDPAENRELPVEPGYPGLAVRITEPSGNEGAPPATQAAPTARKVAHRPGEKTPRPSAAAANKAPSLRSPMPPALLGPQSLRLAAARGNPQAQFEIASRYAKGNGVDRDYKKAAEWYARAAAQGLAPAQYHLAALYERGRGVARDPGLARTWYERAAGLGNVKAMHNLAVMHTGTDGSQPDYKNAAKWFAQAARHGLPDSQFNLGILYESGLGVAKSPLEAYQWLALAAARGDAEAGKRQHKVKMLLPPETVKSADRAVQLWRPRPTDKDANEVRPPRGGWRNAGAGDAGGNGNAPDKKLVTDAQKLLNILGYDAGVPDGIAGQRTKEAIQRFEERSGYNTTGEVTPKLVERLKALIS